MNLLSTEKLLAISQVFKAELKKETQKMATICVVGQTGTGKSSLVNALFGTDFAVDACRPCTKEIQSIEVSNGEGSKLKFYDLPGIGESEEADEAYVKQYATLALRSDVLIWVFHADNRSITSDVAALKKILAPLSRQQQQEIISKLTICLTKADLLSSPPWILVQRPDDENNGLFLPSKEVEELLEAKKAYYHENFIEPFSSILVSRIPVNDGDEFSSRTYEKGLCLEKGILSYDGILNPERAKKLGGEYPELAGYLDAIANSYSVLATSSRFKWGLKELLAAVLAKLEGGSIFRLDDFLKQQHVSTLDRVGVKQGLSMLNIKYWNSRNGEQKPLLEF